MIRVRWKKGSRKRRRSDRFAESEDGVSAVEFALVATPFFLLLFGIIEIGLLFFSHQVLDHGVGQSARLIRTGQAQMGGFDEAAFRADICAQIQVLFSCDGNDLKIDVRTYDSFDDVDLSNPVDDGTKQIDDSDFGYDPGVGGDIVVVRVMYAWPVITPSFGMGHGQLADGKRLIAVSNTFRNEPFN